MSCCSASLEYPPTSGTTTTATSCCTPYTRKCQKLRIVVITTKPWETRPLVPGRPASCTISPGVTAPVTLSGRSAFPVFTVPSYIAEAFPVGNRQSLLYDFGNTLSGTASSNIVAKTQGGCAQASLEFTYNWCGSTDCNGNAVPGFVITKCTYSGLKFGVLDNVSFISSDPCKESVVVLELHQYCPPPNTVSTSCDGTPDGCVPGRVCCNTNQKC
jgi:hypothetical protein